MPTSRSRRGCDTCRKRHIKCDEHLPVCRRCEESRRRCSTRPFISLWQSNGIFPPEENGANVCNWLEIPKRLVFVSENIDSGLPDPDTLQDELEICPDVLESLQTPLTGRPSSALLETNSPERADYSLTLRYSETPNTSVHEPSSQSSISVHSGELSSCQELLPGPDLSPLNGSDCPSPIMPSTTHCRRPLNSRIESLLLQNFVKELSSWFDVTDPINHFRAVVPERALGSEVVLNAIFAISALHFDWASKKNTLEESGIAVDAVLAEVYHTKCIGMLISLINEEASATNDDVLAAAVILRKFEEIHGYVTQHEYGNHLLGVSALFNSRSCAIAGGLAEAAFWQFVRQDAFLSLSIRQPPKIDFSKQDFSFSVSEAPDCVWANRIIFSTVTILTYCFSDETKSLAIWQELNQQVNAWDSHKPVSFTPIFFEESLISEGRYWPELQFYAAWHATGTQYFHLCKILLNLYKPDLPSPGAGLEYSRTHREMKEAIMHHTRSICGIAQSNYFPNPKFNMCPIMLMCGGWFTDVNEQRKILDLLNNTEKVHGWPTKHVRNSLEDHWGMQYS